MQLCCLEIRRFFKDVSASTLEKRSNLEYLEKEFGLRSFLPECVIANVKSKNLKKMIQQQSKKCVALAESACMFKFLDLLRTVYRYDREKFQCDLGVNNTRVIYQFLREFLQAAQYNFFLRRVGPFQLNSLSAQMLASPTRLVKQAVRFVFRPICKFPHY